MKIYRAADPDVPLLLDMRQEAAQWLRSRGSDQWASAWPDDDAMAAGVAKSVANGQVWIVTDGRESIATLTLDTWANPDLWTPEESAEPALYVHRLIVRRSASGTGLGAELLNWCGAEACLSHRRWLRLDAWTTNRELHAYYLRQGFEHVRTRQLAHNPSGALFQRSAAITLTPRLSEDA